MKIRAKKSILGLTLVEMMMSAGCGAFILAAVVAAGVAMQRSYAAVEAYSTAESDQLRVLDYIAMDARRAISVCVSGGVLSLKLPTYYTSVTSTAAANTPSAGTISMTDCSGNTITPTGYYGASGGSVTVNYQQSGTSFTREVIVKNSSGTVTSDVTTAIATKVASFTVNGAIINNGTQANSVSCSIMFFPTFTHQTGNGTWRSGANAPTNGTGVDGDWYVRDTTAPANNVGDVYFRSGGQYSKIQNVKATTVACNTFLRNPVARQ